MTQPTALLEHADRAIAAARALAEGAARHLAQISSPGGKLSVDALDVHQIAAYDLAYIFAELGAAEETVRDSRAKGTELETRLAALFLAEALHSIRGRVQARPAEFGVTADPLATQEVQAYLTTNLAPERYAEIGNLLRELPGGADPAHDSDHQAIADTFRKFAREQVAPLAEKIHRHDLLVPKEIVDGLAELGCFGLSIPETYGGFQSDTDPDNMGMVIVTEELSRGSLAAAGSLITRPEILAKALLKGGTEEQKQTWLPKLATAEAMNAVAVTEPDFGSDVAGIVVTATKTDGGWHLNGVKTWCTFAGYADILMVLARTDPDPKKKHKGLSLFIAEKPRFEGHAFEHTQEGGGKVQGRAIPTIGYRGMHSYEVVFESYFVPDANLIGGEAGLGKGFYLQMEGFAGGRLQTAARALGVMQAALEDGLRYAKDRKVFGKPIYDYPLTQWKLARMAAALHAVRRATYRSAKLVEEGKGAVDCALVKLYACRTAEWVTREAMQIHGGMGYAEEFAVSRYFVDARVLSIFEGAEEVLALRVVARSVVEEAGGGAAAA
ncbi:MAG: acyl-CoA/acyl-ACP dehydrogenase [Deltaproteobacteria bacterium]|nr:acyl-CoA/acyl-ACP dehydrogenase [Deltaproteobacteria bacterium]